MAIDFSNKPLTKKKAQLLQSMSDIASIRQAVEKDFNNRDFAQNISLGMMRVVRFLNTFHSNVRGRLADLNQKLTQLERRLAFIENQLQCCSSAAQ